MAIGDFLATKYSALVELAAQENSIISKITDGRYQPDATGTTAIKNAVVGAINILDYTNDTDLSALQALGDTAITLSLNQKKAFNFSIDDVDKYQSVVDFEVAAIKQAGMTLGLTADTYMLGLVNAGTSGIASAVGSSLASPIAITDANVDTYIYALKESLDAKNADPLNRWLVVPSWFMSKLSINGLGLASIDASGIFANGNLVRYAGFNIVQSNQIKVDSTASGYQVLAFSGRAFPFASQINSVEILRNPNRFGNIVRGLYVFGCTPSYIDEVAVLSCTRGS